MSNAENLLHTLLQQTTETEVFELKSAQRKFSSDKLGEYFSALSNEANLGNHNCAYLVFGVDDNKRIIGTCIGDKKLNEFKREIASNTSLSIGFTKIDTVEINGKRVIIFHIPPAPQGTPVSWKGHHYAREGESLTALSDEKRERFRRQTNTIDWSAGIIEEATLDDLCPDAIAFAREKFSEKNPHLANKVAQWDDITFLNKAKICIKSKITRTAIILLGKSESDHFISPATCKITWILRDRDNLDKDYQHFTCPLLTQVALVRDKIRNIKYRYITDNSLFPDEVDQFDPYIIRESLHNCIAHQDYELKGKINVVEREDGVLTLVNSGTFIPNSIEQVIGDDAPETLYRNPFLANAMFDLNMIDTRGGGIKEMFVIQKNKYFPLPDYDFANQKVKVQIVGKVVDMNYANKLISMKDQLSLAEIMLLDKVSKRKAITNDEAKALRKKRLIEGRKPNYIISSKVALVTEEEVKYINNSGLDDDYYMKLIVKYLKNFHTASRSKIDEMLLDKLPDILDFDQKKNKVRYLLQKLKKQQIIKLNNKREWTLNN